MKRVIDSQDILYNMCGLKGTALIAENEGAEYFAHYYTLEGKFVKFRISKKTPIKTGQFVTMWKRTLKGVIAPYDSSDQIDLFVVNIIDEKKVGQFIFPKSILVEKNVFSQSGIGGKRAMRVYTPWDHVNNIQAIRAKRWQCEYFVDMTSKNSINTELVRKLYLFESVA